MPRSRIIEELSTNKKSVSATLDRLRQELVMLNNQTIIEWITAELNGYPEEAIIPAYRREINYNIIGTEDRDATTEVADRFLPLAQFPKEVQETIDAISVKESVAEIERIVANKEMIKRELTEYAPAIYEYTKIMFPKIYQEYPLDSYEQLLSTLRQKLIMFLSLLEVEIGNIDKAFACYVSGNGEEILTTERLARVSRSFKRIFYEGEF